MNEVSVVIISVLVIVLDLVSKYIIQTNISLHSVEIIKGFFSLTYAENTGMAWSLLSGKQVFLSLVSAIAIGVMIYYVLTQKPKGLIKIALALMIGGAFGNLFDRVVLGYVRDFLDFIIFGYDFPIFNIADSALTIGVCLLILASLLEEKKEFQ